MSVVCDRARRAQLLEYWSKVMLLVANTKNAENVLQGLRCKLPGSDKEQTILVLFRTQLVVHCSFPVPRSIIFSCNSAEGHP